MQRKNIIPSFMLWVLIWWLGFYIVQQASNTYGDLWWEDTVFTTQSVRGNRWNRGWSADVIFWGRNDDWGDDSDGGNDGEGSTACGNGILDAWEQCGEPGLSCPYTHLGQYLCANCACVFEATTSDREWDPIKIWHSKFCRSFDITLANPDVSWYVCFVMRTIWLRDKFYTVIRRRG